ncbi:MAG: beta-ketoacyl-ACP synthase III [Acidobacteria bacterium]|nr:beta-ketoacyl-ACP synthase III [Acidobacteriota bacterium]
MRRAKISAVGAYTPPKTLTNADLEKMVETNDEWIVTRTGIRTRHIAGDDQATSDLAVEAAKAALANRGMDASDVETIIVCTVTPDMFFPSTACLVQDRLGAKGAWGFDLVAACSGLLYGLTTASQLIASGSQNRVLVIGADTMSRIVNYDDRATCVLFGDGAGALLLEPAEEGEDAGLIDFQHEIDGSGGNFLYMPGGGSRRPATVESVQAGEHYVHQEGRQVYRYAVSKMHEICVRLLERNGLTVDDVDLLIPHQANARIISAVAERLSLPLDKAVINIQDYGNTTGGTIPLATQDAITSGRLKKGDLVLMAAVGAGLTAGGALWRWGC